MSQSIFQKLYHKDLEIVYRKFSGIILDNVVQDVADLQTYFDNLHSVIPIGTRILISYHNHFWEPILSLASTLGLRKKVGIQNWLNEDDVSGILNLSGFEAISTQKRFFGITTITIARTINKIKPVKKFSVSIVIPARNEEGNIAKIIPSIPKFGKRQEIIFIEGHSKDGTWEKIQAEAKKRKNVKIFRQEGRGKANAVWLGFEKAKGEILIIYDADRTVEAKDLPKFYNVLALGVGDFANGSRLIYPMQSRAMQNLNKFGNKIFSYLFTKILRQKFKDTLCGTKAMFKKDYLYMKRHNQKYFRLDPFGDFALIFGAIRNNLKVVEIPVRYKERDYGKTNISRFKHGLILIRMVSIAFREFCF